MRKIFLSIFLISGFFSSGQQFPQDFVGHWEGELQWFNTGKKEPQKVKMQLIVKPADTLGHYTWQLVYGENNTDNRPYILKPVDTASGHWLIDEQNGIILHQYWAGGRFTSVFTVQKSTILSTCYLQNDSLVFEFFSYGAKPFETSGGTRDEIPEVGSYALKAVQKAVLKKK
jgi:hypothetical protein